MLNHAELKSMYDYVYVNFGPFRMQETKCQFQLTNAVNLYSYSNFSLILNLTGPGGGGGGGTFHMYAYWVCAANETPIFSHEFPFRSISCSQITKKSVPEHHHFTFVGGFCRSGDHHFQIFFNFNLFIASHGRGLSCVRQRHGLAAVPEIRIFKRSAALRVSGRSRDSHFQASGRVPEPRIFTLKNGSSLFRSPPIFKLKTAQARSGDPHFHRSTRSSFRSPCHFFTLPRHIPTKIWGEYPPPPPPRLTGHKEDTVVLLQ